MTAAIRDNRATVSAVLAGMIVAGAAVSSSCASGKSASAQPMAVGVVAGPAPTVQRDTTATLAGARCASTPCQCRTPGRDDLETSPPPPGAKRFEIRMSGAAGIASLDLSEVGHVATRPTMDEHSDIVSATVPKEACFYIDVPTGSTHDALFVTAEGQVGEGIAPRLSIAEYGPQGPYWYDVVAVKCDGADGRCDRRGAEAWGVAARQRKRGRLEPCGSTVISKLAWETSGGQAERDGGLFRDFTVRFTMEVKKFATQFAPGSTECVPK